MQSIKPAGTEKAQVFKHPSKNESDSLFEGKSGQWLQKNSRVL